MTIREMNQADVAGLAEIDGTIESSGYVHVEVNGSELAQSWRLEERPLRAKRIEPNAIEDNVSFIIRQITSGIDEGLALVAEHEGLPVASLLAQAAGDTLRVLDLRVDYEVRRQGLGLALIYRSIQQARESELRAVMTTSRTDNLPAARLLLKCGFELSGLDCRLRSNYDLVKESVTLFWYAPLD